MTLKHSILILGLVGGFMAPVRMSGAAAPEINMDQAQQRLIDGNNRFVAGKPSHPNQGAERRAALAKGQTPFASVLSCSDSRVPVELLFDQGIGDLFVIRVAGNVADTDEIGTIEYGVGHLHTPLLVMLGHTSCGAVKAVVEGAEVHGSIPQLVDNIVPAVKRAKAAGSGASTLVSDSVKANVWIGIEDLFKKSAEVRELVHGKKLKVVGAVYDIESGAVTWMGAHPRQASLLEAKTEPKPQSHTAAAPATQH